jgi:predicted O-methyltransferase YrrM
MEIAELLKGLNIPTMERCVSVSPREAEFMHRWVKDHGLTRTLEVGLAFGASACCIISAHQGRHTCIDPCQKQLWRDIGLANLASLGFSDRVDFYAEFSHVALPRLLAEKREYDFAFIDGSHLYDGILLDFYYIDKLMCDQGYVLFHDTWLRGTQLVSSFIKRNRKDYQYLRCPARNMFLFQKIGVDQREWDHFREFYIWKNLFFHPFKSWALRKNFYRKDLTIDDTFYDLIFKGFLKWKK